MKKKFEFVAGAACLDFVNTVDAWESSSAGSIVVQDEQLAMYEDLIDWSLQAEIISEKQARPLRRRAEREPHSASKIISRALRLREALWCFFSTHYAGKAANSAVLSALNTELATLPPQILICSGKNISVQRASDGEAMDSMIDVILEDFLSLASSERLELVRMCDAESCGWVFLDTSKNHRRRWCDMKDCGNREKARRFYERNQPASGLP